VCCLSTGTQTRGDQQRTFATFYIGQGPAGGPPLPTLLAR
jgi:hypothetical protein